MLADTNDVAVLKLLFTLAYSRKPTNVVSASLAKSAKQSMVLIAECVPAIFVSVLTTDLMVSKLVPDRVGALKLLSLVIKKRPQVLTLHIPKIVQSVVDLLDPNIPHMRDSLLPQTTITLHDLVSTYPSITFHAGSQRLAVGTADGCAIVYDLKTATRWQVLEGHFGPVTAVSFSKEGTHLLTFSTVDSTVRIWQTSSSFFGVLGSSSRCLKQLKVPQSGKHPLSYPSFPPSFLTPFFSFFFSPERSQKPRCFGRTSKVRVVNTETGGPLQRTGGALQLHSLVSIDL